jgi:hypothetical protein
MLASTIWHMLSAVGRWLTRTSTPKREAARHTGGVATNSAADFLAEVLQARAVPPAPGCGAPRISFLPELTTVLWWSRQRMSAATFNPQAILPGVRKRSLKGQCEITSHPGDPALLCFPASRSAGGYGRCKETVEVLLPQGHEDEAKQPARRYRGGAAEPSGASGAEDMVLSKTGSRTSVPRMSNGAVD